MLRIKNNLLKISVRGLVEFLCQSGDIDNRYGRMSDKNAMEAGSRAHRKIQKSMGPEYKSEVPLKLCVETDKYNIHIEGRADGIFDSDDIYASATIMKPNGELIGRRRSIVIDNTITFIIDKDLTDQMDEIGTYQVQFHLYDNGDSTNKLIERE